MRINLLTKALLCIHFSHGRTTQQIAGDMFAVGKPSDALLRREEIIAVNSHMSGHGYDRLVPGESVQSFKRLEFKGRMFYSKLNASH
jgi:hypothetical protein